MKNANVSLRPGEQVVATAKLHPGAVIVPIVVLVIGLVVALADISPALNQFRLVAILVAAVGLWATIKAIATQLTTGLVMTDERLLGECGVMSRRKMDVPIRNLDSVVAKRSILGTLLGYGTLVINARGHGNLRVEFPQIAGAEKLAEQIRAMMAAPPKPAR